MATVPIHLDPSTKQPYYSPKIDLDDLPTIGVAKKHFYSMVKKRSQGLPAISTYLVESESAPTPNDKLIVSQITTFQKNQPHHLLDIIPAMEQHMGKFTNKYAKNLYFLTMYNSVLRHLQYTSVYDHKDQFLAGTKTFSPDENETAFAQQRSGKYQADNACPAYREEYQRCTDIYFTIDVTTRLQVPVMHQDVCIKPFIALEQCLSEHLENWHGTMHSLHRLENSQAYAHLNHLDESTPLPVRPIDYMMTAADCYITPPANTVFNSLELNDEVTKNTMDYLNSIIKPQANVVTKNANTNIAQYYRDINKINNIQNLNSENVDFYGLDGILTVLDNKQ